MAILRALPRTSVYVFPGALGGPATGIHFVWGRFRRSIGMPDLKLHDLRRTAGSIGLEAGLSIAEVGRMLGHASPRTTEVYLATDEERAQETVSRAAGAVLSLATGTNARTAAQPRATVKATRRRA